MTWSPVSVSVFDFQDSRAFLAAIYRSEKVRDKNFTYSVFSCRAGIRSPNYLKLVIDGKRDLTVANIHAFAGGLSLSAAETDFFECLVLLTQATSAATRTYYRARLERLRPVGASRSSQSARAPVEAKGWADFPEIWVCAQGLGVKDAAVRISEWTGHSPEQVSLVLKKLESEGLLLRDEDRFQLSSRYLSVRDRKRTNAEQRRRILKQLEYSTRALDEQYEKGGLFFCHTFTVPKNFLESARVRIQRFLEELTQEADTQPVEGVAQLNLQYFSAGKIGVRP